MSKRFLMLSALVILDVILVLYLYSSRKIAGNEKVVISEEVVRVSPTSAPVKTVKMILVGDIMLGRTVNIRSLEQENTNYPFEKVVGRLRDADIVFANLESPIVDDCPIIESGFKFCADPKMAEGLVFSGIDVVSLANNHNLNFGNKGIRDTKKILESKGIKWVGDGNLEVIEKEGTTFGFLGFDKSQLAAPTMTRSELDLVTSADKTVDILIIAMHWGTEYQDKALPGVRKLASELIKSGADVISGHHPHWVQDVKYINPSKDFTEHAEQCDGCKPIYYSLGNFVFDQMWSEKTKKGLAIELTFEGGEIVKEEKLPVYMKNWAQPEWVVE